MTMNDNRMTTNDLDNLRHSCAHLLAAAVMDLYPKALRTIGPAIENGFYYDFDNLKISDSDLPAIESKKQFGHNQYKIELIEEYKGQGLTLYKSGEFIDLCRGGHVDHPDKELKHFKLLSVAGAYWRGDEKNKMLTRIYGTVFPTQEELGKYLWQLEEAKKRDHKKLGTALELFMFHE